MSQVLKVENEEYDSFIKKVDGFLKSINKLIKNILDLNNHWDNSHDGRIDDIKLIRESIQSFLIIQEALAASYDNLKLWEQQKFESDEVKKQFQINRLYFLRVELETNFFFNIFIRFENFIRIISESLGITNHNLNKRIDDLIDALAIDKEYKSLIDILIYTRNTMHTGGIRIQENNTVSYKGVDYKFEKGNTPEFWNFDSMIYFLNELFELIYLMVSNDAIRNQLKIEHNYSNITFDYEN
ncbi:MAG TPA: hypothetical protein PLS73_13605 [Saprospiraceae bacterium]|nr:hypothetical protein [Saprospiraceae bacterium]